MSHLLFLLFYFHICFLKQIYLNCFFLKDNYIPFLVFKWPRINIRQDHDRNKNSRTQKEKTKKKPKTEYLQRNGLLKFCKAEIIKVRSLMQKHETHKIC